MKVQNYFFEGQSKTIFSESSPIVILFQHFTAKRTWLFSQTVIKNFKDSHKSFLRNGKMQVLSKKARLKNFSIIRNSIKTLTNLQKLLEWKNASSFKKS